MSRFRARAIVLVLAQIALAPSALAGGGRVPTRCEGARLTRESARPRDAVPVLFVHGFLGSPGSFRRERDGRSSMLSTISREPGVAMYTFDYSEHASQWVTHPAIAPALARAIRCLRDALDEKVVVVAHSMGGLAVRVAQQEIIDGEQVSHSLARVVTIGTPTRGVLLLTYTNDRLSTKVVQALVDAAGEVCDDPPPPRRRRLCDLLDAANAPATTAMAPGSGALAALPSWGAPVVYPIAGDLRLRISVLGVGTTTSLGDVVAGVGSATADPSLGREPLVVRCHVGLADLDTIVDRSPCAHGNLVANRRVIAEVRREVRAAVRHAGARRPQA